MFEFRYLNDAALLSVETFPELGGNINGPSLIAAPDWLPNPPARYLLYIAHHEGDSIRLAISDSLTGPWKLHEPAPLNLAQSGFALRSPTADEMHPEAQAYIDANADGDYPHIASPDVWIDHERKQLRLYYHGRLADGRQRTRLALSTNGIHFEVQDEVVGLSYLRLFRHQDWFYALSMPAQLYRSRDGLENFETGPNLTEAPIRHHALLNHQGDWYVFWTRVGDTPERILVSILDTSSDWMDWRLGEPKEVHRAEKPWEGGDLPPDASAYSSIMQRVNQLRDPAIFEENGRIYLLYAVAGEQGIAIGELIPTTRSECG